MKRQLRITLILVIIVLSGAVGCGKSEEASKDIEKPVVTVKVANEVQSESNNGDEVDDLSDIVEVTVEYEKPGYKHSSNEIWIQGETTVENAKRMGYIGFKNYKNTDKVKINYPLVKKTKQYDGIDGNDGIEIYTFDGVKTKEVDGYTSGSIVVYNGNKYILLEKYNIEKRKTEYLEVYDSKGSLYKKTSIAIEYSNYHFDLLPDLSGYLMLECWGDGCSSKCAIMGFNGKVSKEFDICGFQGINFIISDNYIYGFNRKKVGDNYVAYMLKWDFAGNLIWCKEHDLGKYSPNSSKSLRVSENDEVVLLKASYFHKKDSNLTTKCLIFNRNGNKIWEKEFSFTAFLAISKDGKYIIYPGKEGEFYRFYCYNIGSKKIDYMTKKIKKLGEFRGSDVIEIKDKKLMKSEYKGKFSLPLTVLRK